MKGRGMIDSKEIWTYIADSIDGKNGFIPYALIFGIVIFLMTSVIMAFVRRVFKKMRQNSKAIHLLFFERLVQVLIVIAAIFVFVFGYIGTSTLWHTLFGSTVVIGGIVGIAGQDVIRDILGGLMLSVYKPFDVGDRLYLSDIPKAVVVEDITMRHVVLRARDGMHFIVPNSEINKRTITHSNYDHGNRATYLQIPVAYDADLRLVVKLIRQAVKDCPYTCPNNWQNKDLDGYGDAYLVSIGESAMMMETTIWSKPGTDNDLAVSEAYQEIIRSFAKNGIEIPYNYMNLVERENIPMHFDDSQEYTAVRSAATSTDFVRLGGDIQESIKSIMEEVAGFSRFHGLKPAQRKTIELLSEELISLVESMIGEVTGRFWLEGNFQKVNIHIRSQLNVSKHKKAEFLQIASKNKNAVFFGIISRVKEIITSGSNRNGGVSFSIKQDRVLKEGDDLEKILISRLSDDIVVSVIGKNVEIMVVKKFGNS